MLYCHFPRNLICQFFNGLFCQSGIVVRVRLIMGLCTLLPSCKGNVLFVTIINCICVHAPQLLWHSRYNSGIMFAHIGLKCLVIVTMPCESV